VRFSGVETVGFAAPITGCDSFRTLAHLAFCALAIFRREAADIVRVGSDMVLVGWFAMPDAPEPFNDSITEIA
jgi:hypothetical protein